MKNTGLFITISYLLFQLIPQPQLCSQTKDNGFGFQIGYGSNELQESSLNRIIHKGPGFFGGFFHERATGDFLRRWEFGLEANFLKSEYESEGDSYHFRSLINFRQLYNICCDKTDARIYFGGIAGLEMNIEYFGNWNENHYYWLNAYKLGFDFRIDLPVFSDNKLQLETNLPMVAMVSRSPEMFTNIQASSRFLDVVGKLHENMRLSCPAKHLALNVQVKYVIQNFEKFIPGLYWHMQYTRDRTHVAANVKMLNHTVGLEFKF